MSIDSHELLQDEGIILHVKNWQSADRYAVAFTLKYGKVRFIAYGARYVKNVQGRLLQPFSRLALDVQQGQKIDKLRSCELLDLPRVYDMKQMAYAAVATELTAVFTEDREPQPELYELLMATLDAITKRNPRLVVLSFAIKLLNITGFAPQMTHCVHCGRALEEDEDAFFSALGGGVVCKDCRTTLQDDGLEEAAADTRALWQWLQTLDYDNPAPFKVLGGTMMAVEKLLYKFIFFQTDKPLNSLNFLSQLGV